MQNPAKSYKKTYTIILLQWKDADLTETRECVALGLRKPYIYIYTVCRGLGK